MKYLFTSYHQDGKFISQTPEDKSALAEGRNAFFDVLEEERKGNKCLIFCLVDQETGADILVDLRDGHFEVNGGSFFAHDAQLPYSDFRLIYYRRVTKYFTEGFSEVGEKIEFNLGWQITFNGENIKRIISVV